MSTFVKKVEKEVEFCECDLCGTRQNEHGDPKMEEFKYTEAVEGSHGHDYTQERTLHLCLHNCHDRIGQIITVLKHQREDPKWSRQHYGEFLKMLDRLLDTP